MSHTGWIVVACGLGTFLLRLIPLWQARRRRGGHAALAARQRRLSGIGPAAIAALLTLSLWTPMAQDPQWTRIAVAALALLIVWTIKRTRGGIALPTLAGALAYGLVLHYLNTPG